MPKRYHRIHVRMTGEQYARLKENSIIAGMTMNKYIMKQLARLKPFVFPVDEIDELAEATNEAGRRINEIARAFNSGFGRKEMLAEAVQLLKPVHNRMYEVKRKKDAAEEAWAMEVGFIMPVRYKRHAANAKEQKYLAVRMDDEQYALFEEYRRITHYSRKLLLCRLADDIPFDGDKKERLFAYDRYKPVNKLGSNIRQITRNPQAREIDEGELPQLELIMKRLYTMIESIMRFNLMFEAIHALAGRVR